MFTRRLWMILQSTLSFAGQTALSSKFKLRHASAPKRLYTKKLRAMFFTFNADRDY